MQTFEDFFFRKLIVFRLHVVVLELGPLRVRFHIPWAWGHIINDDCKFGVAAGQTLVEPIGSHIATSYA